ncbi:MULTISPECIES: SOS response-associated peptidase [unclassified Frondihabitans]|uniref:SOS response-associated peptidase n=1 Tax=unclassified Frondihabitans TaxID=2626248 RepID=UPI000F4E7757|nr:MULTISPECIES: SOS response-associated peptidase [unclassified Frondihabitans]RPE77739.1 putative SOS response-associated peptidase YedK [Frondihabitans sp. PhB153]RPF08018.1 putative SOS response-associated peptidase YedK [Frondihabitans sp. PhB161]
MCGRFVVARATSDLLPSLLDSLASAEARADLADHGLPESFNVAPTDRVSAVRERHGERELASPRWGFVPSWYPDLKKRPQPINARIETVSTSGMFRKAFAGGRCIIPAQGYYEWVVTETGKQPHYIFEPGAALAMAGIVTAWPDRSKAEDDPDRWVLSTAIITRDAHVAPGEVHDRMPACLTPESFDAWLDPALDADSALALLDGDSLEVAHALTHYEVSRDANSVRNNGPQLIEPLG